jgi:hypothetical protein
LGLAAKTIVRNTLTYFIMGLLAGSLERANQSRNLFLRIGSALSLPASSGKGYSREPKQQYERDRFQSFVRRLHRSLLVFSVWPKSRQRLLTAFRSAWWLVSEQSGQLLAQQKNETGLLRA